jgi:hypothetical protein
MTITSKTFATKAEADAFFNDEANNATALTIYKGVITVHYVEKDATVETVVQSGKFDSKGRSIDYILGTNVADGIAYGWVQNARDGKEFGTFQRSKAYNSIDHANIANKRIVAERIAKLK